MIWNVLHPAPVSRCLTYPLLFSLVRHNRPNSASLLRCVMISNALHPTPYSYCLTYSLLLPPPPTRFCVLCLLCCFGQPVVDVQEQPHPTPYGCCLTYSLLPSLVRYVYSVVTSLLWMIKNALHPSPYSCRLIYPLLLSSPRVLCLLCGSQSAIDVQLQPTPSPTVFVDLFPSTPLVHYVNLFVGTTWWVIKNNLTPSPTVVV